MNSPTKIIYLYVTTVILFYFLLADYVFNMAYLLLFIVIININTRLLMVYITPQYALYILLYITIIILQIYNLYRIL